MQKLYISMDIDESETYAKVLRMIISCIHSIAIYIRISCL